MDIKKISELDATTVVAGLLLLVETANATGGKITVGELVEFMKTQIDRVQKADYATNAGTASGLREEDTRSLNKEPSYYMTHYGKLMLPEFKQKNTIGLTTPGTDPYVFMITFSPWSDASGGLPTQLAFDHANGMYTRGATSETAWGSWRKVWTQGDAVTGAVFN